MLRTVVLQSGKYYTIKKPGQAEQAASGQTYPGQNARPPSKRMTAGVVVRKTNDLIPLVPLRMTPQGICAAARARSQFYASSPDAAQRIGNTT